MKILFALSITLNISLIAFCIIQKTEIERETHVITKEQEDSIVSRRMADFMAMPIDSQRVIGERLAREYKTRHSK